jgi:peptidoglycan/LPS O-acetylase OafA/YrhL
MADFKNVEAAAHKNPHGAFDGLRLLAASAVLFSHSYALVRTDQTEPLVELTGGRLGLGGIAVLTFFAMSGYLVTQSWVSDPSPIRFMTRRALRIVPALALVIVVSFGLIGPLTTELLLREYFSNWQAWTYLGKILIYPTQYGLPGVFDHNPDPVVVNGSLWTLRVEFGLYVGVAVLGYFALMRRWISVALAALFWIVSALLLQTSFLSGIPFRHQAMFLFLNAVPFFAGAALAQSKLDPRIFLGITAALVVTTALAVHTSYLAILLVASLPFAVILIARYGRCDLRWFGDYSYGIYLFAFPAQQTVVHFLPDIQPIKLALYAGIVTFACAFLSWHLVEKHALALKPRRRKPVSVEVKPALAVSA